MPLPVAVRADHHADVAGRVHPHRCRVVKPDARAQHAHQMRWRDPASLDPGRKPKAAQLARLGRCGTPRLKPRHIRHLDHPVEGGLIIAGVIHQPGRRLIGELVGGQEVLPAHLERVKPQLAAHLVDHTLQRIGRLGAARAAIGVNRGGVGEDRFHVHIDVRHLIRARHQRAVQKRRRHGREVRQIRAHVRQRFSAEGDEIALHVACKFDLRHMVAAMRVGQKAFRPLCRPAHRPGKLFGRRKHQRLFAVVIDLRAETAPHIRGHDLQLVLGNTQHESRNQKPGQVRVLAGGGQLVVTRAGEILANAGARFHRVRHKAVVHQFQRRDMRGGLDRRIHGCAVVFDPAPVKADVVGDLVMHAVRGICHGGGHVHHGWQFLDRTVIGNRLCSVLGLGQGLGNHGGIGIAHMAHLAMRQNRALGFPHRRSVAAVDQPARRVPADRGEILTRKDRQHAGHSLGARRIDRLDLPVRHLRPNKDRMDLPRDLHVIGVSPPPGQKADIFAALGGRANPVILRHLSFSLFRRDPADILPGRRHDRLDDVVIPGATADVALKVVANLMFAGLRIFRQKRCCRHHHARRAKAALQPVMILKRLLDHPKRPVRIRHTLDRADIRPSHVLRKDRAAFHQLAIHMHDTGATLRRVAADMRAGKPQSIPQVGGQQRPPFRLGRHGAAVHGHAHFGHSYPPLGYPW